MPDTILSEDRHAVFDHYDLPAWCEWVQAVAFREADATAETIELLARRLALLGGDVRVLAAALREKGFRVTIIPAHCEVLAKGAKRKKRKGKPDVQNPV